MADQQPSYLVEFEDFQLTASEVAGRGSKPVFMLGGWVRTERSQKAIMFECPLRVASIEQGVALLAYAVGGGFTPSPEAPWLDLGKRWSSHLPWATTALDEENRAR